MDPKPVIPTLVELVRRAPLEILIQLASASINDRLPHEFIATLNSDAEKLDVMRACLIVSILTSDHIILRVFQLRASLAVLCCQDSVIIAGTGSGKTLCLLIPILLRPERLSTACAVASFRRLVMSLGGSEFSSAAVGAMGRNFGF